MRRMCRRKKESIPPDDLVLQVAGVLQKERDSELVQQNQTLLADLEKAQKELAESYKVELVSRNDGTVLCTGSLQGLQPNGLDDMNPGQIQVTLTQVEGNRNCRIQDLEGLIIRIGGINTDELDMNAAFVHDITSLTPEQTPNNCFFVAWPTRMFLVELLGTALQLERDISLSPDNYSLHMGGHHMEIDGLFFKTSPRIVDRSVVNQRSPFPSLAIGDDDVSDVEITGIIFTSFVEGLEQPFLMHSVLAAVLHGAIEET